MALNNNPLTFDKEFFVGLTNSLYRLTLLFPKKEPLRYKMRELADEILANFVSLASGDRVSANFTEIGSPSNLKKGRDWNSMISRLEVLNSFFEVAKSQNWVSATELLRIQEEYNRIKAEIKKIARQPLEKEITKVGSRQIKPRSKIEISARQEKILEILKEKGQAQVWEIKQIFPEVSKRTLRRDFESLLKHGIIERIGERNDTFYQLKTK